MVAISALPVRHHHVEHAVITPTNHSVLRVHRKWQHHRQSQCTATGQARDKAGGKPHSADKVICIDRTTFAAFGTWRNRHDPGRQFFGPGYHSDDYVFTFVTDALDIRRRSDSGSTARRGGCGPVHFLRSHCATHTQPAGCARKLA
jgi:hypothetical protein